MNRTRAISETFASPGLPRMVTGDRPSGGRAMRRAIFETDLNDLPEILSGIDLEAGEGMRRGAWMSGGLGPSHTARPLGSHERERSISPVNAGGRGIRDAEAGLYDRRVAWSHRRESAIDCHREPATLHRPISPPPLRRRSQIIDLPTRYDRNTRNRHQLNSSGHRSMFPERNAFVPDLRDRTPHEISIFKIRCRRCGGETNFSRCNRYVRGVNDCRGYGRSWRRHWCKEFLHTDESGWALEERVVSVRHDRDGSLEQCEICEWWDRSRQDRWAAGRRETALMGGHLWL